MSDAELATIAVGNRVAEGCRAEVTREDAVKGVEQTTGLVETVVVRFPRTERSSVTWKAPHQNQSEKIHNCWHGSCSVGGGVPIPMETDSLDAGPCPGCSQEASTTCFSSSS